MREQIEAVQRMQNYIEQHLFDVITLADLAKVSLFSPWYAHRLFAKYTGKTPADYIRRLRLSRSALMLRDEGCQITQAAFACGFGSVDGYQRAFRREFGCNPNEYAKNSVPLYLFTPYGVKYQGQERSMEDMEKTRYIFIQAIEKPKRKVMIKRGVRAKDYWSYCEEVGCEIWGLLTSMKSIGGEPVCLWLPKEYIREGTSEYVQGVEVAEDYSGEVPEGLETIILPACKYLMFQGEPFLEADFVNAIREVQEAIQKYDPSAAGYVWDKSNPRIQLEPTGTRGYIELAAVKAI